MQGPPRAPTTSQKKVVGACWVLYLPCEDVIGSLSALRGNHSSWIWKRRCESTHDMHDSDRMLQYVVAHLRQ